ncbi:hypothetical protein MPSEU_000587300 [Mayamaea pseudoterrestris]|nr:hypothetical protein MPSEU_000587300 [Mayamaea pseudoterrestris]
MLRLLAFAASIRSVLGESEIHVLTLGQESPLVQQGVSFKETEQDSFHTHVTRGLAAGTALGTCTTQDQTNYRDNQDSYGFWFKPEVQIQIVGFRVASSSDYTPAAQSVQLIKLSGTGTETSFQVTSTPTNIVQSVYKDITQTTRVDLTGTDIVTVSARQRIGVLGITEAPNGHGFPRLSHYFQLFGE